MTQPVILGIGDHYASDQQDTIIKTYALGSCVALILFHPGKRLAAMAHIALPASRFSLSSQRNKPGYYADTAISALLEAVQALPGNRDHGIVGLQAKLVGGANVIEKKFYNFEIGERIEEELCHLLAKYHIPIVAADTGGQVSRTVSLETASGKVTVTSAKRPPLSL
ncbi:MAG: chemotaxis protein CheD [Thermodesulfobacteriota bacterium]